jgi:MtN3 and saliva related transmembrane protein
MDDTKTIGIIAALITAISMIPQLIKIIKEKDAENVSIGMCIVLICGLSLWVWYGIKKEDAPIIATNSFSILTNFLLIYFGIKYKNKNLSR